MPKRRPNTRTSENQPRDSTRSAQGKRPRPPSPLLPPLQGQPGVAALAGEVRTLNEQPLGGVTLRIGDYTARTDGRGRFLLSSIPPGHHELLIDGRTASKPGQTYGIFEVGIEVKAGRKNVLPFTIWMPEIDMVNAVSIRSPTMDEVVVTNPNIPGLEIHLPPGTVIRDKDGQVVTQIGITPIPPNRPPFPLPFGAEFPMYFTVQPGGAYIEPYGARIIYPNITNELPGTRINFWIYDPEEKDWHIYGRGTVTPDGKRVVPDEGVVIYGLTGASIRPFDKGPPPGGGADDGDPVDLSTGLFVLKKTDLFLPDILPISLTRIHRPASAIEGLRPFASGSSHLYEMFLFPDVELQEVDLILPDGGRVHYVRISPPTEDVNVIFEHATTPSIFFKSRLLRTPVTWQLTLKDGTTYTFDAFAPVPVLQSIVDRYGNKISITRARGDHGKATRVVSPSGRSLEIALDSEDIEGKVTQVRDNIGRVVRYDYNSSGEFGKVTDPMGGVTIYTDVPQPSLFHAIREIKDARGINFLTNVYDSRVTKQILADGSTYLFAYTSGANGKIVRTDVTDPLGRIRRVTFNADGYVLTDTRALGTPDEQTTAFERQPGTNLVLSVTDSLGRKTAYAYDSMGNVTSITHLADTPEALVSQFTYDPKFNQVATRTDPLGHRTVFERDDNGSLASITDPIGNCTTLDYDAAGQPISITDPFGNVYQLTYDLGIRSSITDPLGATATLYTDSAGRVITRADPLGRLTQYEFDAHNRLSKITDPLAGVTAFVYDPNSNLRSVTDARGSVTSFEYDDMDRLAKRTDPLGRFETYKYDPGGNLIEFTDRKGQVTTFSYDALNRPALVTFADNSTTAYTYDKGNRLTEVVDSVSGTIRFGYDNLDRVTKVSTPRHTVTYEYDLAGRRRSMTVPGQLPVIYEYDDADHLTKISRGLIVVTMEYDSVGRRSKLIFPGDVTVEYTYDAASQIKSIIYKRGEGVLGDLIYEYDAAGDRTTIGGSFARTAMPAQVSALNYDAANQLKQRDTARLSYDHNGNLTDDGTRNYIWNVRNELAAIMGPGNGASFRYDPFGRRVTKSVNGTTTQFVYDGLNVVQELSGTTAVANILTGLRVDEHLIRTNANGSQILLFDALGSTLALLDSTGTIQTEYTYEPFGRTTVAGTNSANPFQYTGRENDISDLYYYRARYYSPAFHRFISEDPVEFSRNYVPACCEEDELELAGHDINLYAYVFDNPTNLRDPLGKESVERVAWAAKELSRTTLELVFYVSTSFFGRGAGLRSPPGLWSKIKWRAARKAMKAAVKWGLRFAAER